MYRKDRNLFYGGVLIDIISNIKHSPIALNTQNEVVGIEIMSTQGENTVLLCTYRPPSFFGIYRG